MKDTKEEEEAEELEDGLAMLGLNMPCMYNEKGHI